jgi:hypothetical protein
MRSIDGKFGSRKTGVIIASTMFEMGAIPLVVLTLLYWKKFQNKPFAACPGVGNPYHDMYIPLITWTLLCFAAVVFYGGVYNDTPEQPSYCSLVTKVSKWYNFDNIKSLY